MKLRALAAFATCACATTLGAGICDVSAQKAATRTGVPIDVMLTITRLETGRGAAAEPWPWTVNHAGAGSWFQSEDEARAFVFSKVKQGASNIDIGCFQINYRWHGQGFSSLDDMFNPDLNALYAAEFLSELHREFGSWTEAAGAYHSRTPEYSERYKSKFRSLRSHVAELAAMLPTQDAHLALSPNWGTAASSKPASLFLSDANDVRPFIDLGRTN